MKIINIQSKNNEKEYDFSKSEKGKFFNPDAHVNLPVYLEPDNQDFFEKLAKKKNELSGID